jgi:hypothetical protein
MAWESKFINFGVIKIDGKNVKVYCDTSSNRTISVGEEVTNANWAGGELNVTLKSGKVRRYKDTSSYKTI